MIIRSPRRPDRIRLTPSNMKGAFGNEGALLFFDYARRTSQKGSGSFPSGGTTHAAKSFAPGFASTAKFRRVAGHATLSARGLQIMKTKLFPFHSGNPLLHVHRRILRSKSAAWCVAPLVIFATLTISRPAVAAETILLGSAADFAILGGSTVTNTGDTIITGNLGLSPGSSVTGFPPGVVMSGAIHINDALANQAHADAATAFTQLAGEVPTSNLTGINLGGLTLTSGVYHFDTSAQLTGTLTLNTAGDPNAAFHFLIGTTLTTASNSAIVLLNGSSDNVFWEVGSSATLGTGTAFYGTIIADQSITFNTGASLTNGRALAVNGAVTLDSNNINGAAAAIATGRIWNGGASNLWSGVNWSPDLTGATSSTLAANTDVVFSVTGITPQNQNTTLDFNVAISSLTINDPAAVTISGLNLLSILGSGVTTGITINNGAGLATINTNLLLGGSSQTVTVNNAAGLVINGVIDGTIGLTKDGGGALTLTATNTYTGLTTVAAGALEIDGSITGNALVSGGILRGDGNIGGNVVNNARVNPGQAVGPGTLSVAGDYTQSILGTLGIRLGSTVSYDRLAMGGAANLNGALTLSYLNGFNAVPGDVFTIMTTVNGVSGRFSSFFDPHATGTLLTLQVVYQPNDVLLEFVQGSFTTVTPNDSCFRNERAVAGALDKLAAAQPANDLILQLDTVPVAKLLGKLSLLSPEDLTVIFPAGLVVSQVQVGNIERRLEEIRQGATGFSDSGYAVTDSRSRQSDDDKNVVVDHKQVVAVPVVGTDKRWGTFIAGTGEFGDIKGTCAARGSSFTTAGVTVGTDLRLTNQFVLGAAIGYANTSSDLSHGGDLNIDSAKASLYGTFYAQGFYMNGIVGGGYGSFDTKRRTVGGIARGETDGTDFNTLFGTGYDFHVGKFTFGPVASIQYSTIGIDGFSESGALGALRINSRSQDSLKSATGLKASYATKIGRIIFTPQVRAQWQHEYLNSTSAIDAGFTNTDSFTVHGPHIGADALLLDIGASAQLSSKVSLFAYYTGELGREHYIVHGVNGGMSLSF